MFDESGLKTFFLCAHILFIIYKHFGDELIFFSTFAVKKSYW